MLPEENIMIENEIPRERWVEFCDHFTRQHRGWLVAMGVLDTELLQQDAATAAAGTRMLGSDVVLQGLCRRRRLAVARSCPSPQGRNRPTPHGC
jgi:hypothetical protein